jgi:hypothetical protein
MTSPLRKSVTTMQWITAGAALLLPSMAQAVDVEFASW